MINTLLEGVESLRLPCSWVLLIPAIAVTLFGRRRPVLIVSTFVAVATGVAWVRFAGWWFEAPRGLVQVGVGIAVMATAFLAWKADGAVTDALAATVAATVAVWAWIPCVGPELADILNNARREPFEQIDGTIAFVVGLLLPFILVAAAGVAFPKLHDRFDDPRIIGAGAALFGVVGLLFATTLYDDMSSALFRISQF